jgi:hypothetical protein
MVANIKLARILRVGAGASQALVATLASGSPANNPRVPTAADIVELYRRVWR